jgi:hypothetical protein
MDGLGARTDGMRPRDQDHGSVGVVRGCDRVPGYVLAIVQLDVTYPAQERMLHTGIELSGRV